VPWFRFICDFWDKYNLQKKKKGIEGGENIALLNCWIGSILDEKENAQIIQGKILYYLKLNQFCYKDVF